MNNLLIVGAGIYGILTKEIAESTGSFDEIAFVDDFASETYNGISVVGTTSDLKELSKRFKNIIVAIGNPVHRMTILNKIQKETDFEIVSIVSPRAYISPTAKIAQGCIIEPMAVVHTRCVVSRGCIISAGAVVNHSSVCCEGVHVDCNATVDGDVIVPADTKVFAGKTYSTTEKNNNHLEILKQFHRTTHHYEFVSK